MPDGDGCIGCAKPLPESETSFSLISSKFGWRLTRRRDANGSMGSEWRCPDCWQAYKARVAASPEANDLTTDVNAGRNARAPATTGGNASSVWSWVTPWRKSGRDR
jgi:hypothetical protein